MGVIEEGQFFLRASENMRDHWGLSVNTEIENENVHVQKSDAVFFYKIIKRKKIGRTLYYLEFISLPVNFIAKTELFSVFALN